MNTTPIRIVRMIHRRDRLESKGWRARICCNCGGSGQVKGRRRKCAVCNGAGAMLRPPSEN